MENKTYCILVGVHELLMHLDASGLDDDGAYLLNEAEDAIKVLIENFQDYSQEK